MNYRAASRAVSRCATPKNCATSCGVFIIPRKRDKITNTIITHSFEARIPSISEACFPYSIKAGF